MFGWFKGKKDKKEEEKQQQEGDENPDDSELEREGYDPEKDNEVEEYKEQQITDFSQEYPGYLDLSEQEIYDLIKTFFIEDKGDIRHDQGHKKGGRICDDNQIVKKLRSVGKYMLKQVGKKILTGQLNLTKISFPISAMIPKTALETSIHYSCLFPLMMNMAYQQKDPVERMKIIATSCLSSFFYTNTFLKPLNPILGETLQGEFNDGTKVYCEQISHHPPVTYILCVGPNKSYTYYGYYDYDAKAGMNSVSILNKGKRWIQFSDGQKIEFNFPNEIYSGTFIGTLKQESYGKMNFIDKQNDITVQIELGKVKKRPTDYFSGKLSQKGKDLAQIQGTYLGYIDIGETRYWQYDRMTPHKIKFCGSLESDHQKRHDLITLKNGDLKAAQKEKEKLEEFQRSDRKLREAYEKNQQKLKKK